tara:strand:+ start:2380 stop:2838 length:459 start_codon:yes stop_codon:yes gene_type:complete
MICLIQRVISSEVTISEKKISKINKGILILLGIHKNDTNEDLDYIVKKTTNLRIFEDKKKNMNLSIQDINGEILIVSQFTLCAETKKGRRPSFINAAKPKEAKKLYDKAIEKFRKLNLKVETGQFGENMNVNLVNQGPVTIIINSKDNKNEN